MRAPIKQRAYNVPKDLKTYNVATVPVKPPCCPSLRGTCTYRLPTRSCDELQMRKKAWEILRPRVRWKIQDWIFKSKRIRKLILRFFTRQINPRYPGSWCLKGTEESTLEVDSSVPLTRHDDPRDLGLICLVKKRKIRFQILVDFKIQSWIFLKKSLILPGSLFRSVSSQSRQYS